MKTAEEILTEIVGVLYEEMYFEDALNRHVPLSEVLQAMEAYKAQFDDKWVSVEGSLPEADEWVLVSKKTTAGQKVMLMAYDYCPNIKQFVAYGEPFPRGYEIITHWQPIPTPPKHQS